MNFRFTAAMTAAILCAASAVSCGKDASSSSDVVLEIKLPSTGRPQRDCRAPL